MTSSGRLTANHGTPYADAFANNATLLPPVIGHEQTADIDVLGRLHRAFMVRTLITDSFRQPFEQLSMFLGLFSGYRIMC